MDYTKKGKGTDPKQMYDKAYVTRAIGTGIGQTVEGSAAQGAQREDRSDYTCTEETVAQRAKPMRMMLESGINGVITSKPLGKGY